MSIAQQTEAKIAQWLDVQQAVEKIPGVRTQLFGDELIVKPPIAHNVFFQRLLAALADFPGWGFCVERDITVKVYQV